MNFNWCLEPEIGLPKPDIVIYLERSLEAAKNSEAYGEEIYEKVEFQRKVGESFKKLIDPEYWEVLNCDEFQKITDVHSHVLNHLHERFGKEMKTKHKIESLWIEKLKQ
ncbi:MAG: hypothetical protein MHMPM18_003952 [Marteilia pararefringens]